MPVWPVLIQGWQYECCGEPFAVGDRVAWTLTLAEDDFGLPAAVSQLQGRLVPVAPDDGQPPGIAVAVGGLAVWRRGGETTNGVVRLRGLLLEDHHGSVPEALPSTHGVVRRMRVVTRSGRSTGGTWEPAPQPAELRDVDAVPSSFASGEEAVEAGLLVDLDVAP